MEQTIGKLLPLPDRPRILIVKLSAVGDVVHALPTLNAIRQKYPEAYIGWACQKGPDNLLQGHPQIDELIVLPKRRAQLGGLPGFRRIAKQLKGRKGGWDVAIDLQGLTKSGLVAWLSGARWRIGFGGKWSRELNRLFMNVRVVPEAHPVMQMNIGLAEPIGVSPDTGVKAVLHTSEGDHRSIHQWAAEGGFTGARFLLLDPFAGWETKLWEAEKWVEVAQECHRRWGLRPLIFHGPGEEEHARSLSERIAPETQAVVAPSTTLREYIVLLREHVALAVAADTGPMHLASAAGVPVVALFGPSDSRRNAPAFHGSRYIALQDFDQPCAATFARRCKYHPPGKCMSTLSSGQVLQAVSELYPAATAEGVSTSI